jgi:endonuclease/exonuclease/phosphatase family metal-dependent hydrolase
MKIATYNLRSGGKAGNRIHWQKLLDEVNPDIILLQETRHPQEYLAANFYQQHAQQMHWQVVSSHQKWGSAVFVRQGQVKLLAPLAEDLAGWVTGVEVTDTGWPLLAGRSLYVFSLHAPSGSSSYVKQVNAILDCIQTQIPSDADVIIGGDFNLTVGFRHPAEQLQQNQPKLMARFQRELGLMNCWQMANPNQDLPQTLRWSNNPTLPFHCDGIFVPARWYPWLASAAVLSGEDWDRLSDHNPVVATLVQPTQTSTTASDTCLATRP